MPGALQEHEFGVGQTRHEHVGRSRRHHEIPGAVHDEHGLRHLRERSRMPDQRLQELRRGLPRGPEEQRLAPSLQTAVGSIVETRRDERSDHGRIVRSRRSGAGGRRGCVDRRWRAAPRRRAR
jgi:hypothetical protein